MKKAILMLACIGMIATANAQTPFLTNGQIVTNTTTTNVSTSIINTSGYTTTVGVEVDVLNASGTIAGNVILQGSLNGTYYSNISTDTLKLSTTNFSHLWSVDNLAYKYLRAIIIPTGTQSDTLNAYYIIKNKR
jgi:hypothetical protein